MGYLAGRSGSGSAISSTFASSLGTLLTAPGSLNTKSANYTDLIAATTMPITELWIECQPSGVAGAQALIDIAVGAGGSEVIIVPDIAVNSGTGFSTQLVRVPVSIPVTSRVSARWQRTSASLTMRVSVKGFTPMVPTRRSTIRAFGVTAATSRGTSIDPGATINTKPATYTTLSAALTIPVKWIMFHIGNQSNTARTDAAYLLDIATGAAASEQIIIPDLFFWIDDVADEPANPWLGPFPVSIPIGTRLSARAQCSINDATDRLFDVIAYGGI